MARSFNELREKMSIERQQSVRRRADAALLEMRLQDIRKGLSISQEELASEMNISQGSLSKLEHRSDALVSSIRKFIQAMGGELVILARFKDGDVQLNQFSELHSQDKNKKVVLSQ